VRAQGEADMSSLLNLLKCLAWSFLLHATAVAEVSRSGVVEIDLIFPKNDTAYEPTDMMPFVFAVQNANLAAMLNLNILVYTVNVDQKSGDHRELVLSPANLTGKDVYYAYTYLDSFNIEDSFGVNWTPVGKNCSGNIHYESDDAAYGGQIIASFTMKRGAQKADFAAGHAANCSNTMSARFNITGTESTSYSGQCAVLSREKPFPASGNPCAVKVDSAAASSITASLQAEYTKTKCASLQPTISCPVKDSGARGQSPSWHALLLATMLGCVAHGIVS
jgi:hypothetical protein